MVGSSPYWHRIEYRRVDVSGALLLEHVEVCEDAGWVMRPNREVSWEQWFAYYTRVCAEDYFARVDAQPGRWVVTVHRLGADPNGTGTSCGCVHLRWPPKTPMRPPERL